MNREASPAIEEPAAKGRAREWLPFVAVVLVGLALRLPLLGYWGMTLGDGGTFAWLAHNLRRFDFTNGLNPYWPAGYPAHVALALFVPGLDDPETAGRLVSLLLGLGALVPLYLLARRIFGVRVALGAVLLWAVHTHAVEYSSHVLSEATYVFWITWAIYLVWRAAEGGSWRFPLLAGLCFGLAGEVRSEGLILAAIGAAAVLLGRRFRVERSDRLRRALLPAGVVLAGYVLMMSPWLIYMRAETGRWQLSTKFSVSAIGTDLGNWPRNERNSRRINEEGTGYAPKAAPGIGMTARVKNIVRKLHYTLSMVLPALLPIPLWVLLGVGLFGGLRGGASASRGAAPPGSAAEGKSAAPARFFLAAFAFLPVLPLILSIIHLRLLLYALPLMLVLVARGACLVDEEISRALPGRWGRIAGRIGPLLALVVVFLASYNVKYVLDPAGLPVGYRAASEWLRENGGGPESGGKILTGPNEPFTRYYTRNPNAGRKEEFLPAMEPGQLDRIAAWARGREANFIVIGEDIAGKFRPELLPLFRRDAPLPAGLREVFSAGEAPQRVKVFAVVRGALRSETAHGKEDRR